MNEKNLLEGAPTWERTLPNGLVVLVREDHSAPVVAVVTHVKAGYFDEPDELVGISHVLEHMYFKGTERRGVGEIARETKEAGGYLNAGTIYDRTSYYTVLPASSLEQALDVQSDALQRSAIDDEELRKELLVIIQEARRKLDNPGAVAQESLFETMFDVHRIRRWRIGTEEVLRGFTRQHVWDYYRNLYRAANTILVIAGDVEPERAFELAEQYYRDMPAGEPVRSAGHDEQPRRGFRYREMEGDIAQSCMQWGWRTPGSLHDDTPALDVLAVALGQGRASRLYRQVRDRGAVSGIYASNYTPTTVGIMSIGAELDPQDTRAAFGLTAAALQQVLADGFTAAEVERARNIMEARMIRRLETVEGQATLLADWQALGDWRLADRYLRRVLDVTPDAMLDVARRYLQPEQLTALLYRPRTAPRFAEDDDALFGELFEQTVAAAEHRQAAEETDGAAPAAPARARGALRPERVEDDVRFYVLDADGPRIVIKQRQTTPLVSMALYCRGGLLAEDLATAGMTGLMSRTSVKATRTRSGARLAAESEALGAGIVPAVAPDLLDWSISLPARHWRSGLELLLDAALQPSFPAEEAERERKIALNGLEQLRDDMQHYPLRLALASAFPDHPYGFDVAHLEQTVRGANLAGLGDWHRDRVLRGAPYVVIVGAIDDPDMVAAEVAARITAHADVPLGMVPAPVRWGQGGTVRAEQRDKAQTALAVAFPGPPRNHPDVHALQVMSSAIAGLGGRMFEELRSRRSLAYVVTAAAVPRWIAGAFVAYIGTAPEREAEAREALLHELLRTTEEQLEDADVERAQRYLLGSWQIRQQTHARQMSDLAYALLLGEGLAELREYEARIAAVTPAQIRSVAERWLRPEMMVEAVVRGSGGGR
jgi:zinc protease